MTLPEIVDKGKELIKPTGIYASLGDFYSRPFGRDTYYSLLGLIYAKTDFGSEYISEDNLVDASISFLMYINENGELPHEVGTKENGFPFELDADGIGRHFGSIDATGLALLVFDELLTLFPENKKLLEITPKLMKMLSWIQNTIDKNTGLMGYEHKLDHGSREHTWQDGNYAILDDDGNLPPHPIYPVLEQGLYWSVLRRYSKRLEQVDRSVSINLLELANNLKKSFNKMFITSQNSNTTIARAVTQNGSIIHSANIDSLVCLGFTFDKETILDSINAQKLKEITDFLFDELNTDYGLRTQGKNSVMHPKYYYHGKLTIWPFVNIMSIRALWKNSEAIEEILSKANLVANEIHKLLLHFGTPVEVVEIKQDNTLDYYTEIRSDGTIFKSSEIQAWTVAWGHWLDCYLMSKLI